LAVRKVVVTAAGLGTRLLPMSKELPKEMLPIFVRGVDGFKLLSSKIKSGKIFLFLNCFKISFIFVDPFLPEILAEVAVRGKFNFSSKIFKILCLGTLKPILFSALTMWGGKSFFVLFFALKIAVTLPGQTLFKILS
jgi:hypothetical protein